jgi:hypothetical protein
MIKPQQFEIRIDVYQRSVLVCINEPNHEVKRILEESGYEEELADDVSEYQKKGLGMGAYSWIFDDRSCFMRFWPKEINPEFHDQVAHEIAHCAFAILDYIGVELGSKSEEAYTYLIGYITREFYTQLDDSEVTEGFGKEIQESRNLPPKQP